MRDKSNIFGDLPKKPIKQTVEDNRLVERVESEKLYPFKKGSFETYEDFRKRLTDSFQYDISIGTVTLSDKNYDVETKKFFLNIQYDKWFQQLCSLETSKRFYIEIEPSEAKSFYSDYESYELVAQLEMNCECGIALKIDNKVPVSIKKMWLVVRVKNISNHNGLKFLVEDLNEERTLRSYYQNINSKLCNNIKTIKEREEELWSKALTENTMKSYENYCDNTNSCKYYRIAIEKYELAYKNRIKEIDWHRNKISLFLFFTPIPFMFLMHKLENYYEIPAFLETLGVIIIWIFALSMLIGVVLAFQLLNIPKNNLGKYKKNLEKLQKDGISIQ